MFLVVHLFGIANNVVSLNYVLDNDNTAYVMVLQVMLKNCSQITQYYTTINFNFREREYILVYKFCSNSDF